MIKSFKKFFESDEYTNISKFTDSEEYKSVIDKWGVSEKDVYEYLDELKDFDENIKYEYRQGAYLLRNNKIHTTYAWHNTQKSDKNHTDLDKGFRILSLIIFEYHFNKIDVLEEDGLEYGFKMNSFKNFISKQLKVTELIEDSIKTIINGEGLKLIRTNVDQVPFYNSQNDNSNKLKILYKLELDIDSDDLLLALNNYFNKGSIPTKDPLVELKSNLFSRLKSKGVPNRISEFLIQIFDEDGEEKVDFVFNTDDEIYVIATYNKNSRKIELDEESIDKSASAYKDGLCDEMITSFDEIYQDQSH